MSQPTEKPWTGRFTEPTDAFVEAFPASIDFDRRLYRHDIRGSIAHATMLGRVGVLSADEVAAIVEGLQGIEHEIEQGVFQFSIKLEDIHMNIERRLTDRIGEAGKKLHTGRSRNDQVATDVRLWLRDEIDTICGQIRALQRGILNLAEQHAATIMPGFTHLQVAQPITFGHHLLAYFEMFDRDFGRMLDCRKRLNEMPLGSAALAGTTFPIDRPFVAAQLGFDRPMANSLDGVSDRDFAMEFLAAAAIVMVHFSRLSEELILWSTSSFGGLEMSDGFCTGSSIMPQKKNPDVPELLRGKSGRVFGSLIGLLTLMKSLPLAYNKDMQEDKEGIFDAVDTVKGCLKVTIDMLPAMTVRPEVMRRLAAQGFSTATDLADYLVRKGMPFREAHEVVGKLVRYCIESNRDLPDLTLEELQNQGSPIIERDILGGLTVEASVAARAHVGGTAPERVREAAAAGWRRIGA